MRFVQMSCLGASPSSPSRMLRAKAAAEESVLREFPTVITFYVYLIKLNLLGFLAFLVQHVPLLLLKYYIT